MTRAVRPWCARAQYPGLAVFIGGTVAIPADARQDEIEAALDAHFRTFLPDGFTVMEALPGALIFTGDDE